MKQLKSLRLLRNILIFILLLSIIYPSMFSLAYSNFKCYGPVTIDGIQSFIDKNNSTLSNNERESLINIKSKLQKYQAVTQEELDFYRECQLKVIKEKLGEATYDEYYKLIQKREGKSEFSQIDRMRLLQIEKILNSK